MHCTFIIHIFVLLFLKYVSTYLFIYLFILFVIYLFAHVPIIYKLFLNRSDGLIDKKAGRVGNRRKNRDHPNYSVVEVGQNTEKSPGDLKRLTVI